MAVADGPELDLTPRAPVPVRRRRAPWTYAVLAVVVVALGVVLIQGLTNATLYYRNADEAVADKESLGTRRFRVQGVVQDGVEQHGDEVDFTIAFNGVSLPVRHVGDPPELFQPCIPVVLEGRWDGDVFASDRILVKHSSEYEAEHPDRVDATDPCR